MIKIIRISLLKLNKKSLKDMIKFIRISLLKLNNKV